MFTVILFIIVLSVLVFVHELGHFLTAKRAGARVDEFSIGFPPRIFSKKRDGTRYSIGAIPFGGFVKIYGEDETELKERGSFGSLSVGKRAIVLASGVAMNVLLAILLMSVNALIGQPSLVTDENRAYAKDVQITVLQTEPESPADVAGLKAGDEIISIRSKDSEIQVTDSEQATSFLKQNLGEEVSIDFKRDNQTHTTLATLRENPSENEGALGIMLAPVGSVRSPFWRAPWDGLTRTVQMVTAIFFSLKYIGDYGIEGFSGPVGIANLTGDAARLGFVYLLQFAAFLSVNLAILNILPFPALDGGRLVFLAIEKIKGSPVTPKIEHLTHGIGFALLMALILWITFQDIQKLF